MCLAPEGPASPSWTKEYHWLAPAPHRMLHAASLLPVQGAVAFECWLTETAGLAYIWDHRVADHVLFPGAGFFEFPSAGLCLVSGRLAKCRDYC